MTASDTMIAVDFQVSLRGGCLRARACHARVAPRHLALALALLLPAVAAASDVSAPPPLPSLHAPASAYGPHVRGADGPPNAHDLAKLAARERDAGQLSAALALSQRTLHFAPENARAMQTQIRSLSDLGAAHRAYQLAQRHRGLLAQTELQRLRVNATAADIRDARRERKRLDSRFLYAQRNAPLERVLAKLDANLRAFAQDSTAHVRTQRDRLLVLRELGRTDAALAVFEQLQARHQASPLYTQRAGADTLLDKHQPEAAEKIYKRLIARDPGIDVEVYISRYYALIESEDYARAGRLLNHIDRVTPLWQHRPGPRQPNWERLDVDQLMALDAAYRNHNALAVRRARSLYLRAPFNAGLISGYASMLRWRGWPQRAQQITDMAAAYAPKARDTRINEADNARDLGHYNRWRDQIVPLAKLFPQDTTITRSLAEWNDRSRPSMSAKLTVGHSSGNAAISGNRDRALEMRVNTPWTAGGWRAYARQEYRWSDYDAGATSINRVGVGGEWQWARKHAWAQLSNDRLTGRDAGIRAGWSQWLDDFWQYRISADTYSPDTPLRAERAGFHGRSLQTQVTWRASESRSASLSAGLLKIGDGNHRVDLSAQFTQRVQASAHHLTDVSLQWSKEHNSRPGGAYFNPASLHSVGASVEHDWITWRRYQRSFTQRFTLTAASEAQSGFGHHAGVDLEYGQQWQFTRTWSLEAGLGWGSHVYDGNREHRVFGTIGISGVFQ